MTLLDALRHRVQLTTDGHRAYLDAVEGCFRNGNRLRTAQQDLRQCSRTKPKSDIALRFCMVARIAHVSGKPDYAHVSTIF